MAGGDAGRAERIILAACPGVAGRVRRVLFAMREARDVAAAGRGDAADPIPAGDGTRSAARAAAADTALACYDAGARTVVMATIGDPSVYSTFSYLASRIRARRPDVLVEVVPGITAMQAMAAAAVVPLVEGDETLTLVPATAGLDVLEAALRVTAGTVVAYKGGRQLPRVRAAVERADRLSGAWLGTDVGLPTQRLEPLAATAADEPAPYFSTLIVPARTRVEADAHE